MVRLLFTVVPVAKLYAEDPVAKAPLSPAVLAVQVVPFVEVKNVTAATAELIRYLSKLKEREMEPRVDPVLLVNPKRIALGLA